MRCWLVGARRMRAMVVAVVAGGVIALAIAPSAWANDPPICHDPSPTQMFAGGVLQLNGSCTDPDGDVVRYTLVQPPQHGSVSPSTSLKPFVYKPADGYVGSDSFTVQANDGELDAATVQTLSVTVNPHAAPSGCPATVVPSGAYPVRANGARMVLLGLPTICSSPGGLDTTVEITSHPEHGTLTGPPESPIYVPNAGYVGPDSIGFKVVNALGASGEISWNLEVAHGAGFAPQCFGSAPQKVRNDVPRTIKVTCYDEDLEAADISVVDQPDHGGPLTVTPTPFVPVAGSLQPAVGVSAATVTYTPDPGYVGPESFTIVGDDSRQTSVPRTVSFEVVDAASNTAPTCYAGNGIVTRNASAPLSVSCTDDEDDAVTITTVQQPSHGAIGPWGPGPYGGPRALFTPEADFVGDDSLRVTGTDAKGATSSVLVPITVVLPGYSTSLGVWPSCAARLLSATRNETLTTAPIECDPGADPVSLSVAQGPAHGQATLLPSGALRYVPDRNYTGADTITMRAVSGARTRDYVLLVAVTSTAKTKILSGPPQTSTSRAQSFELYTEPGVSLTCALSDSAHAAPAPCSGTVSYADTPPGEHVLTVTATDAQGRSSTDTYAFTVTDPVPPVTPGGGGGSGGGSSSAKPADATPAVSEAPTPGGGNPAPGSSVASVDGPQPVADADSPGPDVATVLAATLARSPTLTQLRRRGGYPLRFEAPRSGRFVVDWYVVARPSRNERVRRVLVAHGARTADAGDRVVLRLRLTVAGRRLLNRSTRRTSVRATSTFAPPGGKPISRSRTIRVTRR